MADKDEKTPATVAAPATGQAPAGAPKSGAEGFDIQTALAQMKNEFMSGLAGLRSVHDSHWGKLAREVRALKAGQTSEDMGDGTATEVAGRTAPVADEDEMEEIRRDTKITRFLQDHPHAREHWNDILAVINDANKVGLVTAYNERGKIDYYKSYRNALNEVLAGKYGTVQSAAGTAKAAVTEQAKEARAQATTSGVAAEGETSLESLTWEQIEAMSPEEMEKRGLTRLMPGLAPQ